MAMEYTEPVWEVRGGIVTGRNRGSVGVGGISAVYSSITWAKTSPITYPPASVNGKSSLPGVSAICCATTTLKDSSFKGSGDGALKTRIDTLSLIVVSPVVVMVAASALSPPSPPVAGQRGSGVWILTLLMLMVANHIFLCHCP